MASDAPGAPKQGEGGLKDLAEDAVGFGAAEFRLTRDLFRRPRSVMDAYDREGSTAGGLYPRPLRYWLTLNGLYLAFSAVTGWQERSMQASGLGEDVNFAGLARRAGKSLEEFNNDFEQWMSLVMLPIYALVIGGALFLLIRRWSPLGDRQDFHQTFTFLNAWTLWTLPPSTAAILLLPAEQVIWLTFPLLFLTIPVIYAVFGARRWWRTPHGAVLKGVLIVLVAFVALVPYSMLSMALGLLGATLLP